MHLKFWNGLKKDKNVSLIWRGGSMLASNQGLTSFMIRELLY